MKQKLFTLLTLLLCVFSSAWGETVTFQNSDLNVATTNTSTISPVTFSITPNGKTITYNEGTLNFGSSGVGMTISANEAKISKIEITADKNRFGSSGDNFSNTYAGGVNTITLTSPAASWSFTTTGGGINITKIVVTYTPQVVKTPVISPNAGEYSSTTDFTITTETDGATIYYSTDGTTPTSASTEYTGTFHLSNSVAAFQIKAIAIKNTDESFVATSGYLYISDTPALNTWNFASVTSDDLSTTWWNGTANRTEIAANTDTQLLNNHGTDLCNGVLFGRSGNKIDAGKLLLEAGKGIRINATDAYFKIPVVSGKQYKITYMTNSNGKEVGFSIISGATVVVKAEESLTQTISNTSNKGYVTLEATADIIVLKNGGGNAANTVLSNIELVATGATHDIVLDANGGDADGSAVATEESKKLTEISAPTYSGHVIAGYYQESECTHLIADAEGNLEANTDYTDEDGKWDSDSDQTLYAKWLALYTVTYDKGANGSGSIDAGVKIEGVSFTLSSETFTRDGYVQVGWATSDGGTQAYALGGSYTTDADITLYPVWRKTNFISLFDYEDGKTISQLNSAGWTFANDGTYTNTSATVDLESAFETAFPSDAASAAKNNNQIAFAKNTGVYAKYAFDSDVTITDLAATFYVGSSSKKDFSITYHASNDAVLHTISITHTAGPSWHVTNVTDNKTVDNVSYIKINGMASSAAWIVLSDISVATSYSEYFSVSTNASRNYGTMVTPAGKKLDFKAVADDVKAYISPGLNDGKTAISIQSVGIVPANTPVIIKTTTQGATVDVPVTTEDADDIASINKLVAGDGSTDATPGEYTYFYIASDQFHRATSGTLKSGKAYLKLLTSELSGHELSFGFEESESDGETTGVASVGKPQTTTNREFYNLAGQRVAQPSKGLYIVNGKKVVIK